MGDSASELNIAKKETDEIVSGTFSLPHLVLFTKCSNLVSYPDKAGQRKLAAGWWIDQCGLKGHRLGEVVVYEKQALVIVNHGKGTAADILALAKLIQDNVQERFGVTLEIEPNIFWISHLGLTALGIVSIMLAYPG